MFRVLGKMYASSVHPLMHGSSYYPGRDVMIKFMQPMVTFTCFEMSIRTVDFLFDQVRFYAVRQTSQTDQMYSRVTEAFVNSDGQLTYLIQM